MKKERPILFFGPKMLSNITLHPNSSTVVDRPILLMLIKISMCHTGWRIDIIYIPADSTAPTEDLLLRIGHLRIEGSERR